MVRYNPRIAATRIDHEAGEWIREIFTIHFTERGIMRWFRFGSPNSWVMETQPLCVELKRLAGKGITMYLTRDQWRSMNFFGKDDTDSW